MINLSQFLVFIKDMFGRLFTDSEMRCIFDFLDSFGASSVDSRRLISTESLMDAVRAPLGPKSRRLVRFMFDRLDREGKGMVSAQDVAAAYDSSKHPDVAAGLRSAEAEYKDFLDGFDVGGEVEGMVTRGEFMGYFTNIAAAMDDEEAFCRLVEGTFCGLDGDTPLRTIPSLAESRSKQAIEPHFSVAEGAIPKSPLSRLRNRGSDVTRSKSELNNDFIFGRSSFDSSDFAIRNMHHHHSGVIFPDEENSVTALEPQHDRTGKKKTIQLRKSAIFFFPDE
jgi:Ca2+-binding EF-hand superfamily protein